MENEAFSGILREEGLRVCVCVWGGGWRGWRLRGLHGGLFCSMFRRALLEVDCKINAEVSESKY